MLTPQLLPLGALVSLQVKKCDDIVYYESKQIYRDSVAGVRQKTQNFPNLHQQVWLFQWAYVAQKFPLPTALSVCASLVLNVLFEVDCLYRCEVEKLLGCPKRLKMCWVY